MTVRASVLHAFMQGNATVEDIKHEERLQDSVRRWRGWGMTKQKCQEALLRNDPPIGATPTKEQVEGILNIFKWGDNGEPTLQEGIG